MASLNISDIKGLKGKYKLNTGQIGTNIEVLEDRLIMGSKQTKSAIYITKQKTGYGEKSFFICPKCGKRRTEIFLSNLAVRNDLAFECRSCIDNNPYEKRCNLYDGGGTDLIEYKFFKLLDKIDSNKSLTNKHIPFDFIFYWNCRPKYMRYEKFEFILKQLTALEGMRMTNILQGKSYTPKEISRILGSDKLKNTELRAITNDIWFNLI